MSELDLNAIKSLPEFAGDPTLDAIFDLFDARLESASNRTHYVGYWPPTVKVGDEEYVVLPAVDLYVACHKAELEDCRARLFADYLIKKTKEEARDLWAKAAKHEPKWWIEKLRFHVTDLRMKYGMAA